MTNLTITVDEQLLKRARIKALENDTSVNALLRDYLEEYADIGREQKLVVEKVLASSRESEAGSGPDGRTWKREDLYEERLSGYERKRK